MCEGRAETDSGVKAVAEVSRTGHTDTVFGEERDEDRRTGCVRHLHSGHTDLLGIVAFGNN